MYHVELESEIGDIQNSKSDIGLVEQKHESVQP